LYGGIGILDAPLNDAWILTADEVGTVVDILKNPTYSCMKRWLIFKSNAMQCFNFLDKQQYLLKFTSENHFCQTFHNKLLKMFWNKFCPSFPQINDKRCAQNLQILSPNNCPKLRKKLLKVAAKNCPN
jgi:hypothetical protein